MDLTLNQIKSKKLCKDSLEILLRFLNKNEVDDTKISIVDLLRSNGIDDTLWIIFNCIDGDLVKKRNMVSDFAESVLINWENFARRNEPAHFDVPRKAVKSCREGVMSSGIMNAAIAIDVANKASWSETSRNCGGSTAAADIAFDAALKSIGTISPAHPIYKAHNASEREKQKEVILKYFA